MSDSGLDIAQLRKIYDALQHAETHKKHFAAEYFRPYDKQKAFFALGCEKRERLFMAGNQLGKSEAGAFEVYCHMTGQYPDWWPGRVWVRPTRGWISGETSLLVRDVQQKKLCGEAGVEDAFGTGMIPRSLFADKPSMARGVTDAYDTIQVKHVSGGVSVARFKSYEQGRAKFQGETLDWFWDDEEPPPDVYSEQLTRITATQGMGFITFTPLKGRSTVVKRFLDEPSEDRAVVVMTIEDAGHISPQEREKIIAGYPPHEREARANGIPMMGEGRIFTTMESEIAEDALVEIPTQWPRLRGIDFGIDHPFGCVDIAWDSEADVIHVVHAFKISGARPIDHVQSMKPLGLDVPIAWPQDGTAREHSSGETLASLYKKAGAKMLWSHSTWPDGGYSTEAGILVMQDRFATGRLKVAKHLAQFFDEYRLYHRKAMPDGSSVIVKQDDDILSALRQCIMMLRFAKPVRFSPAMSAGMSRVKIAEGVDDGLWGA